MNINKINYTKINLLKDYGWAKLQIARRAKGIVE
jgi:hypothetical protein